MRRDAMYRAIGAIISREHILSFSDQAIVSATGFLTTLLIARWSGPAQLGIYALAFSVLVSIVVFQEYLILFPYQIQAFDKTYGPSERAGAFLIVCLLFSAASTIVVGLSAVIFLMYSASVKLVAITLAVAGIAPFALIRDFARRSAIARLNMSQVVVLDLVVALVQLSALSWLGLSGRMSALNACFALGAAYAIPSAGWFYFSRRTFSFRVHILRAALIETWQLGKWLLMGRVTVQVQGYAVYWLTVAVAGPVVTGVYAACMSIVGLANPLMMGISNVLTPKLVLAWKGGGGLALLRETKRNAVLMAIVMTAFSVVIFFAGQHVMRLLFVGREFEYHGDILAILAVATSIGALGAPALVALATMNRPGLILVVTASEAVLNVGLVWALLTKWGLLGASYGVLVSLSLGAVGRWIAFYFAVPKVLARP
jgi:O-antigen/teichoic acid export membrane protein